MKWFPRAALLAAASLGLAGRAQPQISAPATLLAADAGAGELFGFSAGLSGTRAILGSHKDSDLGHEAGAAYVFERVAGGWAQLAELHASDAAADTWYGFAVSIDGDLALVGAPHDDGGIGYEAGAAYVYERLGGVWTEVAKLTASDGAATDYFGRAVSLSGTRALIGAYSADAAAPGSGCAYVFELQAGAWVEVAKLTALDGAADDSLGFAVSLHGARALVGAPRKSDAGEYSGAAYVFEPVGGAWVQSAKLAPSDGAAKDRFAHAVSLYGDRALVGAIQGDAGAANSGSAYLFELAGGVWVQSAEWGASDAQPLDQFGQALALGADRAVIGARLEDAGGDNAGAAYLFERLGASWIETTRLESSAPDTAANFGEAVALSGGRALVGSAAGAGGTGAAYLFEPCGGASQLVLPVRAQVALAGGGTEDAVLGNATVFVAASGRLEARFEFDPAWSDLDDCFDFQWIALEKRLQKAGLTFSADPALGPLPAVYPPASVDPEPFFWSAPDWAAGVAQGETIRKERDFSRLLLPGHVAPGAPVSLELHSYLAVRDVTGRTLGAGETVLLAGFAWRYDGASDQATLCGPVELGGPLVLSAFAAGASGCPGHPGCPGFAGWTVAAAVPLQPCELLSGSPASISLAGGGTHALQVSAGPANAGRTYWILGSLSGSQPGYPLGPYVLPLVLDGYTSFTLGNPGQPPLAGSLGTLGPGGDASAALVVPPATAPGLAGLTVQHALVVLGPSAEIELVSQPVSLDLLP